MTYLYADAAVDASRLTGIPWSWERVETGTPPTPCINLTTLAWWDRWKVAWALIGAHAYVDSHCGPVPRERLA